MDKNKAGNADEDADGAAGGDRDENGDEYAVEAVDVGDLDRIGLDRSEPGNKDAD